ncbi:MAG: NADH-quinone oxidoreductase subunit L [Bdellovibrionales bacterium]|nr:NADH-quinone oxidoreductase subunit L [Bdellovibrionales bacterium]
MSHQLLLSLLLLAPVLGFFINGFNFSSTKAIAVGTLGTLCSFISFICSLGLVLKLGGLPEDQRRLTVEFFNWLQVADLKIGFSFIVDQISAVMILIITGIGTLIHLFSVGYMSHDLRPAKYFAYLNLFLFNMLLLVLSDNLLLMFVGWEGVGLCSYLLIGFWFSDPAKASAGMKAFITNRIGDVGFLIGMFILFFQFGTLNFVEILSRLPAVAELGWTGPITLSCLALFIGATGKSAQIPLYVWLPDAMAGPTPVSALIHAATMVTAGVYMIVRLSGLFVLAPNVMMLIAVVGAATALFAALIGLTQWDIKKVLAYSTVSQLGYMFLAVGVGAFGGAMFHLMTHAFFKALMFLGSGSVIHAMHEEQDIRKMGGLAKKLPMTHATFLVGWLAIIGFPFLSGFFSKDEILWSVYASPNGHPLLWFIGVCGAGCTAFYMTRLMALTFWGKSRVPKEIHPHESPLVMTFPLIILAFFALTIGWVGVPHILASVLPGHIPNVFEHWLEPVVPKLSFIGKSSLLEWALMGISVSVAGLCAWLAFDFYIVHKERPKSFVLKMGKLYQFVSHKFYVDEFYKQRILDPLIEGSTALWAYVDVNFIDRLTYFIADFTVSAGAGLKSIQNGQTQQYALYILLGLVTTITWILVG